MLEGKFCKRKKKKRKVKINYKIVRVEEKIIEERIYINDALILNSLTDNTINTQPK